MESKQGSRGAHREEFRSLDENIAKNLFDEGVNKIVGPLKDNNPVFVSVFSKSGNYHLVVFVGVEIETEIVKGFYYHDPESHSVEEGRNLFMTPEEFEKNWRMLAIPPTKNKKL